MGLGFHRQSLFQIITVMSLSFGLGACGQNFRVLPDDPNNEPSLIAPTPDDRSGQEIVERPREPSTSPETPPADPVTPPTETPPDQSPSPTPSPTPPPPVQNPPQEPPPLNEREQILQQYNYVDPNHIVPTSKLEEAILYYHEAKSSLRNANYLSVIDFGQRSTEKRWYIIDMNSGAVWNIHVAHGKGSDSNHDGYAEKFSNKEGSNASSLGFYKTAETYNGQNGYSLRLDGLSTTNSNARSRAIVIHGADYVEDASVIQGRSWGCPAVSKKNRDKVINLIKGGSLIYAAK